MIYLFISILNFLFFHHNLNIESDKILFIGHGYGSPSDLDQTIDPKLIKFLNSFRHEDYRYIVWGGDFLYECDDLIEISNFFKLIPKNVINKSLFIYGNHEFRCYDSPNLDFIKRDENRIINIGEFDIILANTNLNINSNKIFNSIESKNKKIVFSHQVMFSKSNWLFRANSRENYGVANNFFDKIKNHNSQLNIICGDVGAFRGVPYLTYFKENEMNLVTSGIGISENDFLLSINIPKKKNISFEKIDLNTFNYAPFLPENRLFFEIKNSFKFFFLSRKRSLLFLITTIFFCIRFKFLRSKFLNLF